MNVRTPEQLRWDVAYTFAVHGVPRAVIHRLLDSKLFMRRIDTFAQMSRALRVTVRRKAHLLERLTGRPGALDLLIANTNRDQTFGEDLCVQPNIDSSPFSQPASRRARVIAAGSPSS